MAPRQVSPMVLLILLCVAMFLSSLSLLMLGPLLVALAHAFQTSIARVGQLVAVSAITMVIAAPLVGPVADAYGRRRMLLTGLLFIVVGSLGSILAWHYSVLLACRLCIGVGAALVNPTSVAAIADIFPPAARGQAVGWLITATGINATVGVPLVASLCGAGGWRLPFVVVGTASLLLWMGVWGCFPRSQPLRGHALAFFAPYREVGSHGMVWYVLAANVCQQIGWFCMSGYLAAYLIQTYHLPTEATALPLVLTGVGVMVGSFLGGRVTDYPCRLALFALACWGSGLLAALVFTVHVSPWVTVALAGGVAALARISFVVIPTVLFEYAGNARSTATGLFTMSNQLGMSSGAALGGLLLAWGGFLQVGLFCLGVSVLAAVLIHLKVRESAVFLAQMALRQGTTAME